MRLGWPKVAPGWPGCSDEALALSCRQQGTRAWDLDPVTHRPAARRARGLAGCSWVGWTSACAHDRRLTGCDDSGNGWRRQPTSGAGWVGRIVFVFHAIAVSFDNECLPVMHQPVDQGCGQCVVHVKESLLTLLVAELNSTKGLGPVLAIGVAVALLAMMTLLPALLVIFGRWIDRKSV